MWSGKKTHSDKKKCSTKHPIKGQVGALQSIESRETTYFETNISMTSPSSTIQSGVGANVEPGVGLSVDSSHGSSVSSTTGQNSGSNAPSNAKKSSKKSKEKNSRSSAGSQKSSSSSDKKPGFWALIHSLKTFVKIPIKFK